MIAALAYCVVATHLTILCVTLYLHRSQAHRAVEFHPAIAHAMRFWLWFTTGMVTREWVAVHRYHHQKTDSPEDPHSPVAHGIWTVLFRGAVLYQRAAKNHSLVSKYGKGTPNDFVENWVYTPYSLAGVLLLLLFNMTIFGAWGLAVWLIQMLWIPFWAAGFINGIGHWWGYRNGETKDHSRNVSPWGILIGGEELHNNHHLDPANPKLSRRWFEFDIGWMWFKLFQLVGLAKLR